MKCKQAVWYGAYRLSSRDRSGRATSGTTTAIIRQRLAGIIMSRINTHIIHNMVLHRDRIRLMRMIHTRHGIGEHYRLEHQSDDQQKFY